VRFTLSHALLREWKGFSFGTAPFLLKGDDVLLQSDRSVTVTSWSAYSGADDFGARPDKRFHLGLYPLPFIGDLARAKVVLLLLNPGLGADDYFGEHEVRGFRDRLRANICQDVGAPYPFFFLDPSLAWHSGYTWWHGRLQGIIGELAVRWSVTYAAARSRVACELAAIELVPYHSASYRLSAKVQNELHSVMLAKQYCKEVLVPKCLAGEVTLVVTRRVNDWGVAAGDGAVVYERSEPRAALLSRGTRGGMQILKALG
jgi:hypothetical protein